MYHYCRTLLGNINQENVDLKTKLRSVFPSVPKKVLDRTIPERNGY